MDHLHAPASARTRTAWPVLFAIVSALQTSDRAAAQMIPPPDFLVTVPSSHPFDETVTLLKQAIEGENFMVVHEINLQHMLRIVGAHRRNATDHILSPPLYEGDHRGEPQRWHRAAVEYFRDGDAQRRHGAPSRSHLLSSRRMKDSPESPRN